MKKHFVTACAALALLGWTAAAPAQFTIDGTIDGTEAGLYNLQGVSTYGGGFGGAYNFNGTGLYTATDGTDLFVFLEGSSDGASNNGYLVLLGVPGAGGLFPGSPLGTEGGAGGPFNQGGNGNWAWDGIASWGFFGNHGSNPANYFVDYVQYDAGGTPGSGAGGFWGNVGTAGADFFPLGGPLSGNMNCLIAYNNGGGASQGFELRLPLAVLGITATDSIEVGAFISSGSAFFSDGSAPGVIGGGNAGFNADFSSLGGGPFSASVTLPVEISGFELE